MKPGDISPNGKQVLHEEWGWVDLPFMECYSVWQDEETGRWSCFMVFMGPWNVEIPYLDDLAARSIFGNNDQEYYQWLYENWKV